MTRIAMMVGLALTACGGEYGDIGEPSTESQPPADASASSDVPPAPPACEWQAWRCMGTVIEYCGQTYPDGVLAWILAYDCATDGLYCDVSPKVACVRHRGPR